MVSGTILLIGKIIFLLALYGFLYVVFRGLSAQCAEAPAVAPRVRRRGAALTPGEPVVLRPSLKPPLAPPQDEPAPVAAPMEESQEEPPALPIPVILPPPAHLGTQPLAPLGEEVEEETAAPEVESAGPEVQIGLQPPEPEPEPIPQGPVLVVLAASEAGLESGARISLLERVTVGRADENTIVLHDRFVSSHHAELIEQNGRHFLRDLGSTNGTFCNGARVTDQALLSDGDRVGIGTSVFAFREHPDG